MTDLLLKNGRIILEQAIEPGSVLIRNGRVAKIFPDGDHPAGTSSRDSVDLKGSYLAPGMIDLHIHGSVGVDVLHTDLDGLLRLSNFLLAEGVTGYFATLVPTSDAGYRSALDQIKSFIKSQQSQIELDGNGNAGARVLGIHFEGPFVSLKRCGALQPRHLRTYDGDARSLELFTSSASEGSSLSSPQLITVAPEIDGGLDLVKQLAARKNRVFIGHTQADPDLLDQAAHAGARHITHFPNALDPLHHRKPGAVAWGLVRSNITIDCIADCHHVNPLMLKVMYQAKTASRIALISDAIPPTGLGDGEFEVWGDKIGVNNGKTALVEGPAKGTIAGSVITMRQALKNVVELGVPVAEAFRMSSGVPALASGLDHELGSIREGKRADLAAFDDEFNVRCVVIEGKIALEMR